MIVKYAITDITHLIFDVHSYVIKPSWMADENT